MPLFKRLFDSMLHCEEATAFLLGKLDVNYTNSYLKRELHHHPNYPSLLSIADVIGSSYNVSCIPIRMTRKEILSEPQISAPFIAQIKSVEDGNVFAIVTEFGSDEIKLYNPSTKKIEILNSTEFDQSYQGVMMLARPNPKAEEKEFSKNYREQNRQIVFNNIIFWSLPVITILACFFKFSTQAFSAVLVPVLFTLTTLGGLFVTTLLVWYEVDEYNPTIKKICQASKKVNCSAVLNSNASKLFGLSWGTIGLFYFGGMLLTLLVTGVNNSAILQILSWVNVLALPYTIFSIYYQKVVVKQWCVLCLIVQGVLLLQFVISASAGFHFLERINNLPFEAYFQTFVIFVIFSITVMLLIPALKKIKTGRQTKAELARMKNNPLVFEALLANQKSIDAPGVDLGVTMGNPFGTYKLIKVCNPYCGPCSAAHPVMEEILENNEEISVQVIFTATEDNSDIKKFPVSHFLAADATNDKRLTKETLDGWYNMPIKDYNEFASLYPISGEVNAQDHKIRRMREWCESAEISFTPTFFINFSANDPSAKFYQLPEMYSVSDLKHFLMS